METTKVRVQAVAVRVQDWGWGPRMESIPSLSTCRGGAQAY